MENLSSRLVPVFNATNPPLSSLQNLDANPELRPFEKIIRFWLQFPGYLPTKQDIRFSEFSGWHDRMIISNLLPDGDLEFRLVGETADKILGGLIKPGGTFSALPNMAFPSFRSYFSSIHAGETFGFTSGKLPLQGREFVTFTALDLAASDKHGRIAYLNSFLLTH